MQIKADIEIDAGVKSFATGLLPELIGALRRCSPGDLLAVNSSEAGLGADLETWCRFTRNTLVDTTVQAGRTRWVIRCGEAPSNADADRLWARASGSTRTSTATSIATIVACAPRPKRHGGNLAWRVCNGSLEKLPNLASVKSS
jgi:TusA-related sulfurtransferase